MGGVMTRGRTNSPNGPPTGDAGPPQPGLVELIVIAIPELSATAPVAEAIRHLVTSSSIRILDVVVVTTGIAGTFTSFELEEVAGLAPLRDVEGEVGGWLSSDDIALACDALPPRSTALLLVTEDRWASPLGDALRGCGAQIVGGERIPSTTLPPQVTTTDSEEPL
jgi:hypothetical protein